jgi:hypothetical protein
MGDQNPKAYVHKGGVWILSYLIYAKGCTRVRAEVGHLPASLFIFLSFLCSYVRSEGSRCWLRSAASSAWGFCEMYRRLACHSYCFWGVLQGVLLVVLQMCCLLYCCRLCWLPPIGQGRMVGQPSCTQCCKKQLSMFSLVGCAGWPPVVLQGNLPVVLLAARSFVLPNAIV